MARHLLADERQVSPKNRGPHRRAIPQTRKPVNAHKQKTGHEICLTAEKESRPPYSGGRLHAAIASDVQI